MKIRKLIKEDEQNLIEILLQMQDLHSKNRPDIFKRNMKKEMKKEIEDIMESTEKDMLVAADKDNKVYGLVIFKIKEVKEHINLKQAKILQINKIGVDKKCRKQGIGTLLMKEMKKIAKKLECDRIE